MSLRPVTSGLEEAVRALRVRPDQERLVASNAQSLRDAASHPSCLPFAICAAGEPVGFLMIRPNYPGPDDCYLLRLMVDARHQRRGHGRRAVQLLVEDVRRLPGVTRLLTSYDLGQGHAGPFYRALGFVETGSMNGDEVELVLDFSAGEVHPSKS